MPVAWSVGSTLVRGNVGFPTARPPFPTAEAEARRGRWGRLAGAMAGDPKLIAFLEHHHGREDYLMAAVNTRQAAQQNRFTEDRRRSVIQLTSDRACRPGRCAKGGHQLERVTCQ